MGTYTMATLSLCMVVRDEGAFIGKCLDSVKGVVDEIVVVDTGSTDDTKVIAAQWGAKILDLAWTDDFSRARNYALDHASGEWVLVLDADEVIAQRDHKRLFSLIGEAGCDAYTLIQRTYGDNLRHAAYTCRGPDVYDESRGFAGWIPSTLVRLFRNKVNYRFRYRIHELVEPSIIDDGGAFQDSGIPIHHYAYRKDPRFVEAKLRRYLKIGLLQISENPQDPKPYLEVAMACMEFGMWAKAEEVLRKALELAPRDANLCDALGTLYLHTNRIREAERILRRGLSLRSADAAMLHKLAGACMSLGANSDAEELLGRALTLAPDWVAVHNSRGLLFAVTNRPTEAVEAFGNSLRLHPGNLYALTSLGMLYVNLARFSDALPILERALEVKEDDVRVLYHLAVACLNSSKKSRAIELLKRAQRIQPQDPAIKERLRELSGGLVRERIP